jgi:hypothetical protein
MTRMERILTDFQFLFYHVNPFNPALQSNRFFNHKGHKEHKEKLDVHNAISAITKSF